MRYFRKKTFWLGSCVGLGFLAGILFINFWGDTYFKETLIWGQETLQLIREMSLDKKEYFLYLMKKRGFVILGIWLFGHTVFRFPVLIVILGWLGMAFGILLTSAIVQLQLTGILIFLASLLPQMIFYIPAVWMLVDGLTEETGKERERVWLLFVVTVCVTAGAVLESNVNPLFLQWSIKNFL